MAPGVNSADQDSMLQRRMFARVLRLMGVITACLAIPAFSQSAYQERIVTPHVPWVQSVPPTLRALCLVNNLATREPAELAQRFSFLDAVVVPVTGNAYKNQFDEAFLADALASGQCQLIVIAATGVWGDLSDAAKNQLQQAVAAGLPMLVIGKRPNDLPPWQEEGGKWTKPTDLTGALTARLPADPSHYRGKLALQRYAFGQGQVHHLLGFDNHCTFFTAFVPQTDPYFDQPLVPEHSYAMVARAIQLAVGDDREATAAVTASGESLTLEVKLPTPLPRAATLRCRVLSPFAQVVAEQQAALAAGASGGQLTLATPYAGDLLVIWSMTGEGQSALFGALKTTRVAPAKLQDVQPAELLTPGAALPITFALTGDPGQGIQVVAQVYDPDGRLVSRQSAPATSGQLTCPAWTASFTTYSLRLLLVQDQAILDEQRLPVNVRLDRQQDLDRFHVIVWGTERGSRIERHRYQLLRDLGITAHAPIGKGRTDVARMAAENGLRLVPTNVLVPPNRFTNMQRYSREQDEQQLSAYVAQVQRYTPLGYSLADEPTTSDYLDWRNRGAQIIHEHDPGARVGYCGVKLSRDDDVPGFFQACDFLEMYSPKHLYTPNLWLGVERDLFRSFRRDDAILTSWTHYAPKADHEPYSRTVPWLWLFDEKDGVSYFDSAGNFAILNPDLTTTHETRWWSEEVRRLEQGIAEQLLALRRETGSVRIVWRAGAAGLEAWARALNQMNLPYRFTTISALTGDQTARLVICPAALDLTAEEAAGLRAFVTTGGTLLAVLPLTGADAAGPTMDRLLGVSAAGALPEQAEARSKALEQHREIPTEVEWTSGAPALTGATSGVFGVSLAGAAQTGTFTTLGAAARAQANEHPAFIQSLFATPAMTTHTLGRGQVVTLAFDPDLASATRLLAQYSPQTPRPLLTVDNFTAPVYLYHFRAPDGVQLLGIAPDYWAAGPDQTLDGELQTAQYFQHGKNRWLNRQAQLALPESAQVYDVRTGRHLGAGKEVTLELETVRPTLLALLPYAVNQLNLQAPTTAAPGAALTAQVELVTSSGQPGGHVVHVRLEPPAGVLDPAETLNLHTTAGRGEFKLALPHNAAPGLWTLRVHDVMTGVIATQTVQVAPSRETTALMLAYDRLRVERLAVDWPEGQWAAPQQGSDGGVAVRASNIRRAMQHHIAGYKGQWALSAGFSLENAEIKYGLKYAAVNDAAANKWTDERRIAAPYLPGLGFSEPAPHMWYVNGYLNVFFDDLQVTRYRLSRIEKIQDGNLGRVEVTWDTPYGEIDLAFVLLPDHEALFQEMTIRPTVRFRTLHLKFRGYPSGFGGEVKGTRGLKQVDPQRGAWVLLGNRDLDPAYGKGMGSGALLVLPEQWTKLDFGNGTTNAHLQRVIDPNATPLRDEGDGPSLDPNATADPAAAHADNLPPIQARWALWIFTKMGNNEALQYMDVHANDTRQQLLNLFPKLGE